MSFKLNNVTDNKRLVLIQRGYGRLCCLLCCVMICCALSFNAWAQRLSVTDPDERIVKRPTPERLAPTDQGVLNQILWNESTMVIDGKSYRFNSEQLVVFYLNKERTIVGLKENVRIRYQLVDKDYIAAIWVDDPRGMIVG